MRTAVLKQLSVVPKTAHATVIAIVIMRPKPMPPSSALPSRIAMSPIGAPDAAAASIPITVFVAARPRDGGRQLFAKHEARREVFEQVADQPLDNQRENDRARDVSPRVVRLRRERAAALETDQDQNRDRRLDQDALDRVRHKDVPAAAEGPLGRMLWIH